MTTPKCPHCFTPATMPATAGPLRRERRTGPIPLADPIEPAAAPTTCPSCNRSYPPGWLATGTTCIVMAGATGSGKSIYIAVMLKQLEQFAAHRGFDVSPASPQVRTSFEQNYLKPLYVERNMLGSTPTISTAAADAYQKESLVFTLTRTFGDRELVHHLVVRDVAGEDLEYPERVEAGRLQFFAEADCVFFLFDPLKVEDISFRLKGLVPAQQVGGDPKQVLQSTLALLQGGAPRLAVIMSKFDTVQALREVEGRGDWAEIMRNAGAAFFRDPGPLGHVDPLDGALLHEEVRSLLIRLGQGQLVSRLEAVGRRGGYRFFALSALGDPPRGQSLSARGIAPFRCLDPLHWALAETGMLV